MDQEQRKATRKEKGERIQKLKQRANTTSYQELEVLPTSRHPPPPLDARGAPVMELSKTRKVVGNQRDIGDRARQSRKGCKQKEEPRMRWTGKDEGRVEDQ